MASSAVTILLAVPAGILVSCGAMACPELVWGRMDSGGTMVWGELVFVRIMIGVIPRQGAAGLLGCRALDALNANLAHDQICIIGARPGDD